LYVGVGRFCVTMLQLSSRWIVC